MNSESPIGIWVNVPTWLIVFGGWYVVHRMTLSRERRKEKREIAKFVCSDIRDVERAAIDFHSGPHFDARVCSDICDQVDRLILQLQKPPLNELKIDTSLMISLRQSITLNNMAPSCFTSKIPEDDLIRDIRTAVFDLISEVESKKEQCWQ